jgi:molybdate transport system ATP-binding protein
MIRIDITKNLHGSQGEMQLLVNTVVKQKEFVVLMGESGSGKTTLLRVLAGLEEARGTIEVDDEIWLSDSKILPLGQREIGFVFQDYALFDNMTVEQNLLFVNEDKILAKELLAMTGLTALAQRNVQALSGGQKQRVSLCRAMMQKPKLLLMDEPLSALDPVMRSTLQQEIKQLHERFGTTTIMVSHDVREVYVLADRVWKMEQGNVVQDGTIDEIFSSHNSGYNVEVLKLQNQKATVCVAGEFLEVDVSENVKVGEYIEVVLEPEVKERLADRLESK